MTAKLLGVAPSGATDAATKGYVDTSTTPGNSGLSGGAGTALSAVAGTGITISGGIGLSIPVAVANGGTGSTTGSIIQANIATPATPSAGTFVSYAGSDAPRWKSSNGDVYDGHNGYRDDLISPGVYASLPRWAAGGSAAPVSGTLHLVPVWLPKGFVVGNISWVNANTAGATMTHQWAGLYNSSYVQLATTADLTSSAIATNTKFTWPISQIAIGASATFTTTYAGIHFVGVMIAATTMPALNTAFGTINALMGDTPAWGPSDTAQTTPPAFPHTATTPVNASGGAKYIYAAATA